LLTVSTRLDELAFEGFNLTIKQIVGLMYQAYDCIGPDRRFSMIKPVSIKEIKDIIGVSGSRLIGPVRLIGLNYPPNSPHLHSFGRAWCPLR
jgi:hypothetical protein